MSNDVAKGGFSVTFRLPAKTLVGKAGFAVPMRLPLANITTKAGFTATLRLSNENVITKAGAVVVMRATTGFTVTADSGSYAISGSDAALKVGRLLRAYDNLVLNGEFAIDTSSWTVDGADTTFDAVGGLGVLTLGPAASSGYAWQAVSVVPGQRYTLSAFLKPTNGYTLSAAPGSYGLTGTDVTLTHTSGGGGGVEFSGDSLSGTRYANWTLGSDGYIYKQHNSGAAVQAGPWVTPQIGMGGYEARATLVSGDTPAGTLNTWLSVGQTWGFSAVSSDTECVLLIEIRDATTLTVVASGDVDIFAAALI